MLTTLPLFSGSSGNSYLLKSEKTSFLIDAGVSCKSLSSALCEYDTGFDSISCILVTHEHIDHIQGLETISKKYHIPVYVNPASASAIYASGRYPSLCECINELSPGETFYLNDCEIVPFRTPHDSRGSTGFRINTGDDSFSLATDMGYITRECARNVFGSRTVVIESNHDKEMLCSGVYPEYLKARILSDKGHLSNDSCAAFLPHLVQNGTKRIILAHLSKDNNTQALALEAAERALREIHLLPSVSLEVAPRSILAK